MEKFSQQVKDFFTVRNCLVVIIGLLVVIIIFQNIHGGGGHPNIGGGRQNISNGSRNGTASVIRLPGGLGGGGSRGGYSRNLGN